MRATTPTPLSFAGKGRTSQQHVLLLDESADDSPQLRRNASTSTSPSPIPPQQQQQQPQPQPQPQPQQTPDSATTTTTTTTSTTTATSGGGVACQQANGVGGGGGGEASEGSSSCGGTRHKGSGSPPIPQRDDYFSESDVDTDSSSSHVNRRSHGRTAHHRLEDYDDTETDRSRCKNQPDVVVVVIPSTSPPPHMPTVSASTAAAIASTVTLAPPPSVVPGGRPRSSGSPRPISGLPAVPSQTPSVTPPPSPTHTYSQPPSTSPKPTMQPATATQIPSLPTLISAASDGAAAVESAMEAMVDDVAAVVVSRFPHTLHHHRVAEFYEEQRFRHLSLVIITLTSAAVVAGIITAATAVAAHRGSSYLLPLTIGLILCILVSTAWILVFTSRLQITVRDDELYVHFFPFCMWDKRVRLCDVTSAKPVNYDPISEYGGWGISYSPSQHMWVFAICGTHAVEIATKSGVHFMVGTTTPHELVTAVLERRNTVLFYCANHS
ncbi:hypothetical protein Pelo_14938 [Pelomyxa schiedti]|nr:hypothetical protein Pelo_14938 [Pelomyxa schiedti]